MIFYSNQNKVPKFQDGASIDTPYQKWIRALVSALRSRNVPDKDIHGILLREIAKEKAKGNFPDVEIDGLDNIEVALPAPAITRGNLYENRARRGAARYATQEDEAGYLQDEIASKAAANDDYWAGEADKTLARESNNYWSNEADNRLKTLAEEKKADEEYWMKESDRATGKGDDPIVDDEGKDNSGSDKKKVIVPIPAEYKKGVPEKIADKIEKSDYDIDTRKQMMKVAKWQTEHADIYEDMFGGKVDGMWGKRSKKTLKEIERRKKAALEQGDPVKETTYSVDALDGPFGDEAYKYTDKTGDHYDLRTVDQLLAENPNGVMRKKGGIFYSNTNPSQKFQRGMVMSGNSPIAFLQSQLGLKGRMVDGKWEDYSQNAYEDYMRRPNVSPLDKAKMRRLAHEVGVVRDPNYTATVKTATTPPPVSYDQSVRNLQEALGNTPDGDWGGNDNNSLNLRRYHGQPAEVKKIDSMYNVIRPNAKPYIINYPK